MTKVNDFCRNTWQSLGAIMKRRTLNHGTNQLYKHTTLIQCWKEVKSRTWRWKTLIGHCLNIEQVFIKLPNIKIGTALCRFSSLSTLQYDVGSKLPCLIMYIKWSGLFCDDRFLEILESVSFVIFVIFDHHITAVAVLLIFTSFQLCCYGDKRNILILIHYQMCHRNCSRRHCSG